MFKDRRDAGKQLAKSLSWHAGQTDVVVLALPRGGVPVGYEVAKALGIPLEIFVVRKLGIPGHEEYAMGAIASGGVRVLNMDVIRRLGIDDDAVARVAVREREELDRRETLYRSERPQTLNVEGKIALVVDDGLATGASMDAAVRALSALKPRELVAAVPVGSAEACDRIRSLVDELVCLQEPVQFRAVGNWYQDFSQTSDAEVKSLLDQSLASRPVS